MRPFILILLELMSSFALIFATGCQNRAPSLRLLDARSGYGAAPEGYDDEEVALYQRGRQESESLVRKSAPRVVRVYVYPHELPSKDYFWGGYMSLVVSPDEWILDLSSSSTDTKNSQDSSSPAIHALPAEADTPAPDEPKPRTFEGHTNWMSDVNRGGKKL